MTKGQCKRASKKKTTSQLRLAQNRQTRPLVMAEFVQGENWLNPNPQMFLVHTHRT
jgi:hypothetical protein